MPRLSLKVCDAYFVILGLTFTNTAVAAASAHGADAARGATQFYFGLPVHDRQNHVTFMPLHGSITTVACRIQHMADETFWTTNESTLCALTGRRQPGNCTAASALLTRHTASDHSVYGHYHITSPRPDPIRQWASLLPQ